MILALASLFDSNVVSLSQCFPAESISRQVRVALLSLLRVHSISVPESHSSRCHQSLSNLIWIGLQQVHLHVPWQLLMRSLKCDYQQQSGPEVVRRYTRRLEMPLDVYTFAVLYRILTGPVIVAYPRFSHSLLLGYNNCQHKKYRIVRSGSCF